VPASEIFSGFGHYIRLGLGLLADARPAAGIQPELQKALAHRANAAAAHPKLRVFQAPASSSRSARRPAFDRLRIRGGGYLRGSGEREKRLSSFQVAEFAIVARGACLEASSLLVARAPKLHGKTGIELGMLATSATTSAPSAAPSFAPRTMTHRFMSEGNELSMDTRRNVRSGVIHRSRITGKP
jgi:hypothetical protein